MADLTRRAALKTGAAATLAAGLAAPAIAANPAEIVVVGAGVFGAWTARHLQRAGRRVLLLDA